MSETWWCHVGGNLALSFPGVLFDGAMETMWVYRERQKPRWDSISQNKEITCRFAVAKNSQLYGQILLRHSPWIGSTVATVASATSSRHPKNARKDLIEKLESSTMTLYNKPCIFILVEILWLLINLKRLCRYIQVVRCRGNFMKKIILNSLAIKKAIQSSCDEDKSSPSIFPFHVF